jgi:curved DNA-binding protein CbpA
MDYKKDYYSILGVEYKATREELRAAYRRLAKLHHPDKNAGNPDAEERFKAINEAYEILSNEITRHIYDGYRADRIKEEQPKPHEANGSGPSYRPTMTRKTRTSTVKREKRIYVRGGIEVKFQGDPELSNNYARQWEQRFTIYPTEVLATILSSEIYKNGPPKEYQLGYSTAGIFATPLKQPVNCKIITGGEEEYYQLDLYDIRIKDPILKDITRHDQYSFGTLHGMLFGYVLHQYDEELTEEYTEYSGATGHVETKTESGDIFTRQQFYAANGSTHWAEWKRSPVFTGKYQGRKGGAKPIVQKETNSWSDWSWLIVLIVLVAIWPPLLYVIIPLTAGLLFVVLLGWVVSAFDKLLPFIGALLIGFLILSGVRSLFHDSRRVVLANSNHGFDSVSSKTTVVREQDKNADTVISHNLRWEDKDSARYAIQFSVPLSVLHMSTAVHERMDEQEYALQGISSVYRFLLDADNAYTKPIANAFDSLAKIRSLDRQHEASMVVSCIQSIPYSLIVDKSCSANYTEGYVSEYLANCAGDCCKGYSKFGVQSPVEFIGDLKGDCDTRALLLYDLLGKLGYKVALMTSNYYKHALIAVNLDKVPSDRDASINIDGLTYYLWETTSKGFGPGELPATISNINHWNIALIQ